MTFRLESFGALQLLNEAGEPASFPEKGLLTLCYLLDRPDSECPRGALARFLWDSRDNADIMANLRKMISRVQDGRPAALQSHHLSPAGRRDCPDRR